MRQSTAVIAVVLLAAGAAALNNGMGLHPPLGWSSWCSEGGCGNDYCHEHEVRDAATAMLHNGMFQMGYRWILLDDCWAAGNRTASGELTWDTQRFPSGIPALVHWLHSKGFRFGLYTSAGNTTCSSGGRPYRIPGSEHHYQQDANTFASWELDYVKVDWCGDVKKMPFDGLFVGAKDYIAWSHAITNTTPKRNMYLEGVAAVLFLLSDVPQYMNAWRASTDHHDKWSNTLEILATVEAVGVPGASGAWSYMDVLMTGGEGCERGSTAHCPKMTDIEYQSEFTLWSVYQSPLVVATDVRNMTAIMQKVLLNEKLVIVHQSTATKPGRMVGTDDDCALLGLLLCQYFVRELWDGSVLLVLFNANDSPATIKFDFSKNKKHLPSGWGAPGFNVTGDDQWQRGWANSTFVGSVSASLDAHAVYATRLYPQ